MAAWDNGSRVRILEGEHAGEEGTINRTAERDVLVHLDNDPDPNPDHVTAFQYSQMTPA